MRYIKVTDNNLLLRYKKQITAPAVLGTSATIQAAKSELKKGLLGLLETFYPLELPVANNTTFIAGTAISSPVVAESILNAVLKVPDEMK